MDKIKLNKLTEITRGRIDRIKVFSDFLELSAIRISNRVDPVHYKPRDERAKFLCRTYYETELEEMNKYFNELFRLIQVNCNTGICEDILGHVFEESGFTRTGQDQTPPDLARLVAKLSMGNNIVIPKKGFIDLDECACGSGSLVLAAAENMTINGLSYSKQLVVRATDTDPKCVHMAYIQLSLYGIPAVVIHGNTITLEEYARWYTPMYVLDNWVWHSPFSLAGEGSSDDEQLKRMTDPYYDAVKRAETLFQP